MNKYSDYVYYQGTNNPVAGVAVSVYLHNTTTPAVLYTSAGVALPTNIVTTDQTGYFEFYTLTGQYDLYILGALYYTVSINEMTGVPDPLTLTGLTVSGTATLATANVTTLAVSGAATVGTTLTVTGAATFNSNLTVSALGIFSATGTVTLGTVTATRFTSVNCTGNIIAAGTSPTLTGDMSNSIAANRFRAVSSVTNGATDFDVIPNGTSTSASMDVYNANSRLNCAKAGVSISATAVTIFSAIDGSGTLLPLDFSMGSLGSRMRLSTLGNILLGTITDDTISKLQVVGSITSTADGFTAPYALPQSGVRTAGSSAFQTNIRSHMFSDTAGARPAIGLSKNLLAGGYPSSTGGGLGVLQYGTIIPSTQTFTSQAEISAYTAEAWTDSARGSTLQFFTTPIGSTTLTERMRISAAGNLVVGSVTDSNNGLVAAYKSISGSDTSTAIAVHSSLTDSSDGTGSASHFALSASAGFTGVVTGGALMGATTMIVNTGTSFSTTGTLYGSLLQFVHSGTPTTSTIMGNLSSVTLSAGTTVNVATALRATLGLNGTLTSTAYGIRSVISSATTTNASSTHCFSATATLNGTTTTVYGAFYALNPSTTSTIGTLYGTSVIPTLPASGTNINNFIGHDVSISTAGMLCNGVRCYQATNSAIQAAASGGFAYAFNTDANTKPGVVVYAFLASGNAPCKFNGGVNTPNLPIYADNAAAIAGGLVAGDHYRTSTGVLMVRY